ncbi:MAG: PTS glucose transporter subunit IIA [Clostridiales bacterium]|nr:PTS glucose transporter subunit IIA [Clostridiales bacterium]
MGLFGRKKKEELICLMTGTLLSIEQVPDPAFATKVMGDGFAVELTDGKVIAPVSGTVTAAFPTGHAFGITTADGMEILIHLGIDTVNLKGQGFQVFVKQGDNIKQGESLAEVDINYVKSQGMSLVSPVVFTGGEKIRLLKNGTVRAGDQGIVRIG